MSLLRIIIALVPQVISFVHMAEAAFPNPGSGASKLNAVLDATGAIVAQIPTIADQVAPVKAALAPIVSSIVGVLNTLGIFKKAAPATDAAASSASGPLPL